MPAVGKRADERQPPHRRRQEVLEAAATVFSQKGYDATSIQDIAESVGILKGSLYYYIHSKEQLLDEILQTAHDDALVNIQIVDDVEGDALQKIRVFVTRQVIFNAENRIVMSVFFRDLRSLGDERRHALSEERRYHDRLLRTLIQQGQDDGTICPDVDPEVTALAVMAMVGCASELPRPEDERALDEVANQLSDLVVCGLACTSADHHPGHRRERAPRVSITG